MSGAQGSSVAPRHVCVAAERPRQLLRLSRKLSACGRPLFGCHVARVVFCHPERGTVYRAETFRAALRAAPFHDLRHASLTNGAAAGESPLALMARAGHRSMRTTNAYVHLAGVVFREDAARLEQRLLGRGDAVAHRGSGSSV